MTESPASTPVRFQCRHIFTDGHRCASPALRRENFCYYHHETRKPIADPAARKQRTGTFDLPVPEDRSAIQHSIGEVLQRIASNDVDPRRAGLLLYGLQIASLNLPKPQPTEKPVPTVDDVIQDDALGALAPPAEYIEGGSEGQSMREYMNMVSVMAVDDYATKHKQKLRDALERAEIAEKQLADLRNGNAVCVEGVIIPSIDGAAEEIPSPATDNSEPATASPSAKRPQRHHVAHIVPGFVDRGLRDKGGVVEAAVMQEPSERIRANGALANMLVTVELGAHGSFRIVAVPDAHGVKADGFADQLHRGVVPLGRHDVIARNVDVAGIETNGHRGAWLQTLHQLGDLLERAA